MCVDRKEPLPNASLWNRLKLENEMLRSFYTNEKSIHVSTFQYGSKIQIKEIVH